jgi:arginine/lysine/ornithine decarboxylase
VTKLLTEHPEIEVVYLTNPTYDGLCFNVSDMKTACGDRIFIVDEAHGAHFYFSEKLPQGALQAGADAAVTSVHKTLGGLSGTALLNLASHKLD